MSNITLSDVVATATATPRGYQVYFGLYLPGIRASDGFEVIVRLIHQADRFDPRVPTTDFPLVHQAGSPLDLWCANLTLTPSTTSRFGSAGLHLYRFQLWWTPTGGNRQLITNWFTDPFAQTTDVGSLSALLLAPNPPAFPWTDQGYKTPELDDLVVYELQVEQFNDTFDGVIDRLPYLQSLGVNCLELMPATTPKIEYDWNYGVENYFAPCARFGGPVAMKRLVDACHAAGMAVILDVVYQHVDPAFTYHLVYDDLNRATGTPKIASPMIGSDGMFGPQVDFSKTFAQDYFAELNRYWLAQFHLDGFRYDEVTDLYVGPMDSGYAKLAYDTYRFSLNLPRFQRPTGGYSRIIQCAEALWRAADVLRNTYTNCAWQDDLLNLAEGIVHGDPVTEALPHVLDPFFLNRYPGTKTVVDAAGNPVDMPVAPFQYLNTHDHSHLVVFAGTTGSGVYPPGDRSQVWRLQPFAIALYTAQGIPMLWEGEEFADDYNLPSNGSERINLERNTHWSYFYDNYGNPLVNLYRRLGMLRRSSPALRSRQSFYYWQHSLQGSQLVAYHRHAVAAAGNPEQYALVILNFASHADTLQVPFPKAGRWTEMLDNVFRPSPWILNVAADGDLQTLTVPSNYGCIFIL